MALSLTAEFQTTKIGSSHWTTASTEQVTFLFWEAKCDQPVPRKQMVVPGSGYQRAGVNRDEGIVRVWGKWGSWREQPSHCWKDTRGVLPGEAEPSVKGLI